MLYERRHMRPADADTAEELTIIDYTPPGLRDQDRDQEDVCSYILR